MQVKCRGGAEEKHGPHCMRWKNGPIVCKLSVGEGYKRNMVLTACIGRMDLLYALSVGEGHKRNVVLEDKL